MKISRLKKVQRNLEFYINNYKFHTPYQVLIDGTFTFAALKSQCKIKEQLPKYFQAETKLLTTPCIIIEMEKLGSKVFGALLIVKQFGIHKCQHAKAPVSGSECFLSMIRKNNESRYIIATQDRNLQNKVRSIPGVPLLYLHDKTPHFEQPSEISKKHAQNLRSEVGLTTLQKETLQSLKEKFGLVEETKEPPKKKKKKGGKNPLSCKKKKTTGPRKVKKRKKNKIPEHVKEVIVKELGKK